MTSIQLGARVYAEWEGDWYLGTVCDVPGATRSNFLVLFDGQQDVEPCLKVALASSWAEDDWDLDDTLDMKGYFSGKPQCCNAISSKRTTSGTRVDRKIVLFDSHCHVGEHVDLMARVRARLIIMGTHEEDWPRVAQACTRSRKAIPGFGVHPWFAHKVGDGWLDRLRCILKQHPDALLGEVGLDKVARTKETNKCEYATQQEVFRAQLLLAHELRRPVSVHCVQSWGKMMECLQEFSKRGTLPPAIAIHSWAGPAEWVAQLTKTVGSQCQLYFGFSEVINHRGGEAGRLERLHTNLKAVAEDRLLLESDLDAPEHIDQHMGTICNVIAKLKGPDWTYHRLAEATAHNALTFAEAGKSALMETAVDESCFSPSDDSHDVFDAVECVRNSSSISQTLEEKPQIYNEVDCLVDDVQPTVNDELYTRIYYSFACDVLE